MTQFELEHCSVSLPKEQARRQYGDRGGRSRPSSRSDGDDPAAIPNTRSEEAIPDKSLKIALAHLRKEYSRTSLSETEVDPDPLRQFKHWFTQAFDAGVPEPNVMTLATVSANGRPSARIVLIKEIDACGFIFFTHYESRKGRELAQSPHASLLFHWIELERQVRIEGTVEKMSAAYNDTYFESRPLASRISAWASQQSTIIPSRAELEARVAHFAQRFGAHPPRPPNWGGYRLIPDTVEFWQGRPSRLHDRIQYARNMEETWAIARLAP